MKDYDFPTVTLSYSNPDCKNQPVVRSSVDAYKIAQILFDDCMELHEKTYVLLFNRRNKYLGSYCVGSGSNTQCVVNLQGLLQAVVLSNAVGCMLVHNHPSGSLVSSSCDDILTEKTQKAVKLFEVTLLDHLIVTADGYYSYADEGRLF